MLDQKNRDAQDQKTDPGGEGKERPRSDVEQLADEARSTNARFTAPLMFGAGVLIAVAMAVLIAQNRESTTVEWLAWDPTGPMWIVLVLTFVAGLVSGPLLLGAVAAARHRRHVRDERIDELTRRSRQA